MVSRYLNRRLSRPLAKALATTAVTPNQLSVFSFAIALGSALLFFFGHLILAGLLAQASSIVDGADGDLARLKGKSSPFGGFFDALLDRYADVAILLGMAFWCFRQGVWGAEVIASVGVAAIVGSLLVSYSRARAEAAGRSFTTPLTTLASRDTRLLLVMVGALIGQVFWTLVLLALLGNGVVMARLLWARRHF